VHYPGDGVEFEAPLHSILQIEDAVVAIAVEEGLVTPHTSAVGVLLQVSAKICLMHIHNHRVILLCY